MIPLLPLLLFQYGCLERPVFPAYVDQTDDGIMVVVDQKENQIACFSSHHEGTWLCAEGICGQKPTEVAKIHQLMRRIQ